MAAQSKGTGSPSGFKRFFEQNKTLVFLLPVLLIMIVVVIIIYIPKGGTPTDSVPAVAENTATDGNKVEVLPQTERVVDETAASKADSAAANSEDGTVKDPFAGPMTYSGVLINSNGDNIAVIEGNGKSFVVRKGDMIGSSIQVDSISAEEVVLKDGDRTINLKLEQKKNSTTVNK